MKKQLLFSAGLLAALAVNAQNDTLLWNNFNTDPFVNMQIALPPGAASDTSWYTFDVDGQADGSGGNRPLEWFWSAAYSDQDTLNNGGVMGSSSWTNSSQPTENLLITPSVYIGDTNAVLSWKSAPRQTPRYLDGYQVIIGTATNDLGSFLDTVFFASEYTSLDNSNAPFSFASYTFTPGPTADPLDPFVHGMDASYTEFDAASDSSRLIGRLRPFSISLAQFSGQTIFVMFRHFCVDDNLISVDDILITGTDLTSVAEASGSIPFKAYPNPANDIVNISFELPDAAPVTINVYDMTGKLISTEQKGNLAAGPQSTQVDVSVLATGLYRVELVTGNIRSNTRVVVQ